MPPDETSGPDQQVEALPPFEQGTIAGLVRLHGRAQALANCVAQERDKLLDRWRAVSPDSDDGRQVGARARELSTAVTNLQQGAMWLRQVLDEEEPGEAAAEAARGFRDALDLAEQLNERIRVEVKEATEEARRVSVPIRPRPGWAPVVVSVRDDATVGELLTTFLGGYSGPAWEGEHAPTTRTSVLVEHRGYVLNDADTLRDLNLDDRLPLTVVRW